MILLIEPWILDRMANSKESESEDNRIFSKQVLAQAKECFAKQFQDGLEIHFLLLLL